MARLGHASLVRSPPLAPSLQTAAAGVPRQRPGRDPLPREATAAPVLRDLVLVGGGHAHVEVLRRFGLRPQAGTRLTLIAADPLATYSGMLPGLLAGHYRPEEAQIDLRRLAAFAGARFHRASATGLDLGRRLVLCDGRPPVPFDLLSLDIGSIPDTASLPGADRFALPARPAARLLEAWRGLREAVAARGREGLQSDLVVVGGGAAGIELALALRHRLAAECAQPGALSLTVLVGTGELLPGHGAAARRRALAALDAAAIRLLRQRAVRFSEGWVHTEAGEALPALAAILATHAAAPPWLRETGLALDGNGFVRTDSTLRSVSHPEVFATGDVAAVADRALPKSGVFAVRQGPVLARNLRRSLEGRPLLRYRPQRRALALLSTGPRHAIASYGRLAFSGAWVWRLKDRIDRRWIAMYR
jgi:selenide,water dikinase